MRSLWIKDWVLHIATLGKLCVVRDRKLFQLIVSDVCTAVVHVYANLALSTITHIISCNTVPCGSNVEI